MFLALSLFAAMCRYKMLVQPANCYLAAELSVRKIGFPLVQKDRPVTGGAQSRFCIGGKTLIMH